MEERFRIEKPKELEGKRVEITLGPSRRESHVWIDGREFPCTFVAAEMDASEGFTRYELHTIGTAGDSIVVRGTLSVDEEE